VGRWFNEQATVHSAGVPRLQRADQSVRDAPIQSSQSIDERPKRPGGRQRIAPALQHPQSWARTGDGFADHSGFADSGLTAHQHHTSRIAAHPPGQPAQLTQLGVSFQQPGHDQPRRAATLTEQSSKGHPDMMCNYFNAAANTARAKSTAVNSAF
jgi:hypothetical protein